MKKKEGEGGEREREKKSDEGSGYVQLFARAEKT